MHMHSVHLEQTADFWYEQNNKLYKKLKKYVLHDDFQYTMESNKHIAHCS